MPDRPSWTPSNRSCVRICALLLCAHRAGRIELPWLQLMRVRDGVLQTRYTAQSRRLLGRLWHTHGGLELARALDRYDRLPDDVRSELEDACA